MTFTQLPIDSLLPATRAMKALALVIVGLAVMLGASNAAATPGTECKSQSDCDRGEYCNRVWSRPLGICFTCQPNHDEPGCPIDN
jgi:hypothetical protein